MACSMSYGAHRISLLQLSMVIAAASLIMMKSSTSAPSSTSTLPTMSWSRELSISIAAGNGSAIVKGSALVSPDHKSWAFGVVSGLNTTDNRIPVAFGIFKAVDSSSAAGVPTWEWQPLSSSDIASATVSFSPGNEIVLSVKWRNGTGNGDSVAWSSDTGGEAEAVALTNSGELLLLDAENRTIWQRPTPPQQLASAPAPLEACPANICLLPPPPSSSPPAPPATQRPSHSPASQNTFPLSLWLSLLIIVPLLI